MIQKSLGDNSDRICEVDDRRPWSHAFDQTRVFQHRPQIPHGARETACAHGYLADEPVRKSDRFVLYPRIDTAHANARDDVVRSFKGMLRIGIGFEARANSSPLAHRFRDPPHGLQAFQIWIPKRQLVQVYVVAKVGQAVDQERRPKVPPRRYCRGSSGARCGERSAYIAGSQALLKRPPREMTVKKTTVEGITCPCCIHRAHANGFHSQDLPVANGQGTIWTKLDYWHSHPASQFPCSCLDCLFPGHGLHFRFIWKRTFEFLKQGWQSARLKYLGVPPQIR